MGQAAYQPAWPRTRPLRPSCSTARCCARGIDRARRGGPVTFLLDRVREDLEERLQAVTRSFSDVAEICYAGRVAAKAAGRSFPVDRPRRSRSIRKRCRLQPESLDLAVSALAFQFVNDLPGVLAQIRRALKPDGLLLAAMIGGDTLTELRQSFAAAEAECEGGVSPRVAALCRSARSRRAAAARGLCAAGHRRRSRRGALRQRVRADGRSAADGRDQYPDRAAAHADPPRHHAADGADLRRTLCRSRRPHPRDLRYDLAVRLGAA